MRLYLVNFNPLLSSLYMFRAAHAHHQEYNVQLVSARPHREKVAVTICADTMVCTSGCRYS